MPNIFGMTIWCTRGTLHPGNTYLAPLLLVSVPLGRHAPTRLHVATKPPAPRPPPRRNQGPCARSGEWLAWFPFVFWTLAGGGGRLPKAGRGRSLSTIHHQKDHLFQCGVSCLHGPAACLPLHRAPVGQELRLPRLAMAFGFSFGFDQGSGKALATGTAWAGLVVKAQG